MKGACCFACGEGWGIHDALVEALIKDVEPWVLCECQRHGIVQPAWSALPHVSLSLHVVLFTFGKLLRLFVPLHLNRDLEHSAEIVQVYIIFSCKHRVCLE